MKKSLIEQANDLAYKLLIRRLSQPSIENIPAHGEKIEILHPDKLNSMGKGGSAIGG